MPVKHQAPTIAPPIQDSDHVEPVLVYGLLDDAETFGSSEPLSNVICDGYLVVSFFNRWIDAWDSDKVL
jgi:hypothetical protein